MSVQLPDELLDLEANGGIFAVWMLLQNYSIHVDIQTLVQCCKYDPDDGTFTISLAVGLRKLGFDVVFHTAEDPDIHIKEIEHYTEAIRLGMTIEQPLTYQDIQTSFESGYSILVYYDTLEGVGNHSLVYSIDDQEICFYDSFDPMEKHIFEQQCQAEGICQQAIVIRKYCPVIRYS
ncbi:peptidase C39 [Acinetobacter nematophilus]|uniref:Peptidase C39 n=1 Tax=Acinetobacter nematophilus TaxID=2994642 RepID=A0A9X3IIW7_9GAMM|nr:peptidase C39 [Acinetobacter nematophilus]MCX5469656.1 peptidase C39 [Acinetobacter nematophilus]